MDVQELARKHNITVKSAEMLLGIGVTHTYVPDKNVKSGHYHSVKAPREDNRAYRSNRAKYRNRNDIPDLI